MGNARNVAKGWLYPTSPTGHSDGGLTGERETIIVEEFNQAGPTRLAGSFGGESPSHAG